MKKKSIIQNNKYFSLTIIIISIILTKIQAAPIPQGWTKNDVKKAVRHNPPTYDIKRSTWQAKRIEIPSHVDIKENVLADLKFKGNDLLKPETKNVKSISVKDGILSFTTDEDALVYWGDHYEKKTQLPYLMTNKKEANVKLQSLKLKIRIKQSLPESHLRIFSRRRDDKVSHIARKITLKGTEWQERTISFRTNHEPVIALGIFCQEAGNHIEVDWIKICSLTCLMQVRKTLDLLEAPVDAALCLYKRPANETEAKKLFINGKRVPPPRWGMTLDRYKNLAKYFRKGKNVIAFEGNCFDIKGAGPFKDFFMEGMVRLTDGKVVNFATDSSWKGMYNAPKGWNTVGFDDSKWAGMKPIPGPFAGFNGGLAFFLNPPYYGPIDIIPPENGHFMYNTDKSLKITVKVWGNNFTKNYELCWRLEKAETGKLVKSGVLEKNSPFDKTVSKTLKLIISEPGVYDLYVEVLENNKIIKNRVVELSVIGKIKQREIIGGSYTDGLDLELTDEIDCTEENSPYRLFSESAWSGNSTPSYIRNTSFGKYRESGDKEYDWFGFGVKLDDYFKPFLMEVDYPDDKIRNMSIRVIEKVGANNKVCYDSTGHMGWPLTAPGFYTGIDHELTNKMKTFRFIFFPKTGYTGIIIMNQRKGMRAAASQVRIYRIKNDLPSLKIGSPSYRLTGQHLERSSIIPLTFYSGPDDMKFCVNLKTHPHRGFYKDWYNSIENMIKYMKFTGENMLVAGIYMYFEDNQWMWRTKKVANYLELMGRMCEANGIKVILGVEYGTTNRKIRAVVSDKKIAEGAYTSLFVSKEGKRAGNWCGSDNFLAPRVREHLFDVVKQLCDLYKNTPGIAGICFQEGGAYMPAFGYPVSKVKDPLDWGYGDNTVPLFEKETGTHIPVASEDPERFRKRYDWLMKNAKDKWIDWRNKKLYEVNRDMGKMVHTANSDWRLFIASSLTKAYNGVQPPKSWFRRHSFAVTKHKNDPNIVFGTRYVRHVRSYGREFNTNRIWSNNPDVIKTTDDGVAYILDGFFEMGLNSKAFYFDHSSAGDYILPSGRAVLEAYARIMSYATPKIILQTWLDVNMLTGHEENRREFNRVFQVIPPGKYQTLTGDGLDINITVRATAINGGHAFYVVNCAPWSVKLKLCLKGGNLKLTDLAMGEKQYLGTGNILSLKLKPFEMRVYTILGNNTGFLSAEAQTNPELPRLYLKKYQEIRAVADSLNHRRDKLPEDKNLVVGQFLELEKQAAQALKNKNWSKARELLDSYRIRLLINKVNDLITPIAWRIIGPFDNLKSKGFDIPYPVEKDILSGGRNRQYKNEAGKLLKWQEVIARSIGDDRGFIDFLDLYSYPTNWKVAYAQTYIKSDKDRKVKLLLGSDDGIKVWINGKLIFKKLVARRAIPRQNIVETELKKGWNIILVKVENQVGGWSFFWDITDLNGKRIPELEYQRVERK